MRKEGATRSVLLGRDTDPADLDIPANRSRVISGLMATSDSFHHSANLADALTMIRGELSRSITNQETASFVKADPSRLLGVGSINLSKSEEYVFSKLEEVYTQGLIGIKLYPPTQFFNPSENENLKSLCERLRKRKKILVFHTGFMPGLWESPIMSRDANPKYLEPVAKEYDSVPFVLAHFGAYSGTTPGIWFDEAVRLGESAETSGSTSQPCHMWSLRKL